MNEENKVVTNNQEPERTQKVPVKKPHDNKMALLSIITLVFGIIMTVSLIVALGARSKDTPEVALEEPSAEVIQEVQNDDELGTKKLLREIDEIDFEELTEDFSDQKFEEDMY